MDVTTFATGAFSGLGNSIPLLATIFGIVALAGGAAGYFKASRGDSIIKYQAAENDLLRNKNADLEKDMAGANQSIASKDETINELKKHNNYLQKLGQGSPELKKLRTAIENQTKVIAEALKGKRK